LISEFVTTIGVRPEAFAVELSGLGAPAPVENDAIVTVDAGEDAALED
jgi:hypothetical protein